VTSTVWHVRAGSLSGRFAVPGDKSIAHRALLLAALADGESVITNVPSGLDVRATADCISMLGMDVVMGDGRAVVRSSGRFTEPEQPLDARNSGTTMRLLAGLLAGQTFRSVICGDASLSRRPMERITAPLTLMGSQIQSEAGHGPLIVQGRPLHGIRYTLPVASAQVKSAILLAGLFAQGITTVVDEARTRDHTERMLKATGVVVSQFGSSVSIEGLQRPQPFHIDVPGDISTASFLLAGAALSDGNVVAERVGLNPGRIGFLDVLRHMGARVTITDVMDHMGEPVGDVRVQAGNLRAIDVQEREVPGMVDEVPLVALLATQAQGRTVVRGAAELRLKESDRLRAIAQTLRSMGACVEETADGLEITGPTRLRGTDVHANGDHRVAMMLGVAGTIADGETVVHDAGVAAVSFPGYRETINRLGGHVADA